MRVSCLRHGETDGNVEGRFNGSSEESLTSPQANLLRRLRFDHSLFDAIYCSPLTRCIETAQCLSIRRYVVEPRIAERGLGIFEGLTPAECELRFPAEFAAFRALDANFVIPSGESRAQNAARVLNWIEDIGKHDDVLAVTHGGTIDILYRLGTGIALHGGDRIFSGDNAAISIFEVDWPSIRLVDFDMPLVY